MFKKIDHVEIVPSNFEKSLKFYTEILEFKIERRWEVDRPPMKEIAFLKLGDGTRLEMFSVAGPAPKSREEFQVGCRKFALEVEDLDKAVEILKANGINVPNEPVTGGNLKRTEIKDPDGLTIELLQRL